MKKNETCARARMQASRRIALLLPLLVPVGLASAQSTGALKTQAVAGVKARAKLAQEINDSLFSFSELGFQETETQRYLSALLEKNGFTVERGIAGMPSAWIARWSHGTGGPTIALGSDVDCIPKASQKPGIPWHEPLIEGAPGHGEGHNSGQAVNIVAALSVQELMKRNNIPGTLVIWPGIAEELLGGKAYFVRDGVFAGVDAVLFTHVANNLGTSWGYSGGTGLVSVEYTFAGDSAHSAMAPWRGRSALDGVQVMTLGWEMRREHLRPEQRSHYVITDGGDQPNVVPSRASVWFYFREQTFEGIGNNYKLANKIADAATQMTDTTVTHRVLGTAAPQNFNRPLAEAAYKNIKVVGLPQWTEDEQKFAKAVQKNLGTKEEGLTTKLDTLEPPPKEPRSGGSDDIGDVSWNVPTITVRYPSNIPNLPGHHWANAIAMATPIAHKGVVAGSQVIAMTTLDLLTDKSLLPKVKEYFTAVTTKDQKYVQMLAATDRPATELNAETMGRYKEQLKKYYYDPSRYDTYLQQLGITFPTLEKPAGGQ
jgi:aminobenzoyl-glutamate utilization protein B